MIDDIIDDCIIRHQLSIGVDMLYSVSLFFRSNCGQDEEKFPLWEEKIYIVSAEDELEARELGMGIGRSEEHEYYNSDGHVVRWRFIAVERVCLIECEMTIGEACRLEVFSRFLQHHEASSILKPMNDIK